MKTIQELIEVTYELYEWDDLNESGQKFVLMKRLEIFLHGKQIDLPFDDWFNYMRNYCMDAKDLFFMKSYAKKPDPQNVKFMEIDEKYIKRDLIK